MEESIPSRETPAMPAGAEAIPWGIMKFSATGFRHTNHQNNPGRTWHTGPAWIFFFIGNSLYIRATIMYNV